MQEILGKEEIKPVETGEKFWGVDGGLDTKEFE